MKRKLVIVIFIVSAFGAGLVMLRPGEHFRALPDSATTAAGQLAYRCDLEARWGKTRGYHALAEVMYSSDAPYWLPYYHCEVLGSAYYFEAEGLPFSPQKAEALLKIACEGYVGTTSFGLPWTCTDFSDWEEHRHSWKRHGTAPRNWKQPRSMSLDDYLAR